MMANTPSGRLRVAFLLLFGLALVGAIFLVSASMRRSGELSSGDLTEEQVDGTPGRPADTRSAGSTKGGTQDFVPVQVRIRSPEAAPALTNDSAGPLFVELNSAPGTTSTRCIAITNVGAQLADVRLFATTTSSKLAGHVDLLVETGSGGAYDDCDGFEGSEVFHGSLEQLAIQHGDFTNGLRSDALIEPQGSSSFRLTQRLHESAPQGASATAIFGWEARNAGAPSPFQSGADPVPVAAPDDIRAKAEPAGAPSTIKTVLKVSTEVAKRGWVWVVLLILVALFMVVQDRIDRRDPRLASARVYPETDLPFESRNEEAHAPKKLEKRS